MISPSLLVKTFFFPSRKSFLGLGIATRDSEPAFLTVLFENLCDLCGYKLFLFAILRSQFLRWFLCALRRSSLRPLRSNAFQTRKRCFFIFAPFAKPLRSLRLKSFPQKSSNLPE